MTGCSSDFVLRGKRRVKLGVLPLWISLPVTDSAVRPGWSVTFLSKLFCGVKLLSVILNSSILTIEQVGNKTTKMTLRMKPSRGLSHHPGPEPGPDPGSDPAAFYNRTSCCSCCCSFPAAFMFLLDMHYIFS